ncbi:MAG: hydrogenase nickel incorporation protein HypB [Bacteroidota bacterium]
MGTVITIEQKILKKNNELAEENRQRFDAHNVFVATLVSSPGSGKTSLLEQSLRLLRGHLRVAVIEGDVQTNRDAQRIAALDVPVVQIVTSGTCHLEARMIQDALQQLDLDQIDLLFIENVGNLVCPASYDLGEHLRIVVMSITEGEDKPIKYPAMFRKSQVLVMNKVDLLPFLVYNLEEAKEFALRVNPSLRIFETSCTTGHGIQEWTEWLMLSARTHRSSIIESSRL